jgi:hypothetical protein
MKRLFPAFIAIILFLGCDGSSDSGNGGTGPLGADAYFPLQIGNWWRFGGIETDSLDNPIPGTEYVHSTTVVGDTIISDHTYYMMLDSMNMGGSWHLEELQFVRLEGDTIKFLMSFFDESSALYDVNMVILPYDVGETWNAITLDTVMENPIGDPLNVSLQITGELLATGPVTVPVGTLENAVHIGHVAAIEISNPDTSISFISEIKFWLAPDIGQVRQYEAPFTRPLKYSQ